MNPKASLFLGLCAIALASCNQNAAKQTAASKVDSAAKNYGDDRQFLEKHVKTIELSQGDAKLLVVPKYQGRVMTSTCQGDTGFSFGWINYNLIESNKYQEHINAYGGEERLWMGPEGGQFALFFKKGDPFDIKHWQTPAIMDTVTFDLINKTANSALFSKSFEIENYSGTKFNVNLKREIGLLDKVKAEQYLGVKLDDIKWVGYQAKNTIQNTGDKDWDKANGVLSIWLLSMLKAAPHSAIIIPYQKGGAKSVNDTYFGNIPAERLVKKDDHLIFKADAHYRSKIGIPPATLKPIAGSYDADKNVLTIMQFDYNGEKEYVNSVWKQQPNPYSGDVLNAYNDGPNDTGTQLGPFYEMETSSPAVALKKQQTLTHVKRIFHFSGDQKKLNAIAVQLLGVELSEFGK